MQPTITTYIYIRPDGRCVHSNCGCGFIGQEYEHNDANWQPPEDWPYEIRDMRKDKEGKMTAKDKTKIRRR